MRCLLTNDDGIDAPGLAELHRVASQWSDVLVVAPKRPWSGCGHQICTDREIEVAEVRPGWWSVDAFPADCVRIGTTCITDQVDWVISGINDGGNLGADVFVSGTVAAAREASLLGYSAIAISQYRGPGPKRPWSHTGDMADIALKNALARPLERDRFWNINLPDPQPRESISVEAIRQLDCPVDINPLPAQYEKHLTRQMVVYSGRYQDRQCEPGSDVYACFSGAISMSQIAIRSE